MCPFFACLQTLQSRCCALFADRRQLTIAGLVTARLRAGTERYVMTFIIAPAFASTLNRRFADLIADLPFAKRFRISRVATLFDPTPQCPLRFANLPSVFSDLYLAESHRLNFIKSRFVPCIA